MGNTILYILLIVAIYTTILNYRMVKRNKNSSGYVKCANALFKGRDMLEGATTLERNSQIGGHRA